MNPQRSDATRTFAGPDGVHHTADDVPEYCTRTSYDANDNVVQKIRYTGSGMDGIWFTADDDFAGPDDFDTSY